MTPERLFIIIIVDLTYCVGAHQERRVHSLLWTGRCVVNEFLPGVVFDTQFLVDHLAVVVHMANVQRPKVPEEALVDKDLVRAKVLRVQSVLRLRARLERHKVETVWKRVEKNYFCC